MKYKLKVVKSCVGTAEILDDTIEAINMNLCMLNIPEYDTLIWIENYKLGLENKDYDDLGDYIKLYNHNYKISNGFNRGPRPIFTLGSEYDYTKPAYMKSLTDGRFGKHYIALDIDSKDLEYEIEIDIGGRLNDNL